MPRKKTAESQTINKRKLALELGIFAAIILAIVAGVLIFLHVKKESEYEMPKEARLYEDVLKYDYENGRDSALESRIKRGTENVEAATESDEERLYYNYVAKAIYYYNFEQYSTALEGLTAAENYAGSYEESARILMLYYYIYSSTGATEKAASYAQLLNGDYSDFYTDEEIDEILEGIDEELN